MRKMKDSGIEWIGEIPEGGELRKGKSLYRVATGKLDANAENPDGDYPFFTCSMVPKRINSYSFDCEALLVAGNGLVGFTQYYKGKFDAYQRTYVLSDFRNVLPSFLRYYVSVGLPMEVQPKSIGSVIQFIKLGDLLNFNITLPSIEQQTIISNYLEFKIIQIDAILSKTRSSIEEYKKLKQAVITQAVTKGVRGEREMKDSGVEWIGEIPKEWICEKIKYATSISRGLFNHRPRNDERYYNGKYPFIQTGDVANATKYIVSYSQTLNELGKAVSKEFPKGTLTMTIAANVGDVAILNFDAYFPDSVVCFIPNKNIRTLYLFYFFYSMKDEFTRTAIKSTQLNLNIDRVKETFIPVTLSVNEQCEIENYLESKCAEIDGLIAKKEQLVKELESYKKSLIYEVVTGKREV